METKVVLDEKGRIVSAIFQKRPAEAEYEKATLNMGPVTEEGQTVVELGVPDEYASLPLSRFVESVKSEVKAVLAKSKG